jgi:hypothetical protein
VKQHDDPQNPTLNKAQITNYIERIISIADHDMDQMISFQEFEDMEMEIRRIFADRH